MSAQRDQLLVALFAAFLLASGQPSSADKCTAGCSGNSKPTDGFQAGTTYTYMLDGTTRVELSGTNREETGLKISAQATVVGLGNCANLLKISSLMITGLDGTKYDKPLNIEKPVRFTLQDGILGSDICTEQEDSRASLNIKRAILSMLQTAHKHNTEVDIFGVCPTTFDTRTEGGRVVITKTRNLNGCAQREQGKHDLLAVINPKAAKSSHLMDATLNVDTYLKNGIVEKSVSNEEYLYIPFSSGSAGARASVVSSISLQNTNKGALQANCVVPKSIIFESPVVASSGHSNIHNIHIALQLATQAVNKFVGANSASVFSELVKVLRASTKDDLTKVYNEIKSGSSMKNNQVTRRVFLDALFRTGTSESVELSIKLINDKEFNQLERNIALISLTGVLHASAGSLKAAMTLLDAPGMPNEVYLGVGALAGAYCRDHPCHGAASKGSEIENLSKKLNTKIANCKSDSKTTENSVIFALKAVKNIHHIDDSLIDTLAHCAADRNIPQRLRVAALETYSADACIPKLQQTALSILKDRQQDSEVRIKAYLALIVCPSANLANEIKTLLATETINQVGSFITSSLLNIRATANPTYANLQKYFENIPISKKFPMDARRFSQNFEVSYENEMLGNGNFIEGNVIYSQNSFLPRSSNFNLTTEIFGRNLNLLEVGFRQGNLDRVLEEYFGPHGVFKTNTPQKVYDGVKHRAETILDKIKERMDKSRHKRNAKQQAIAFGKNLKHDIPGYNGDLDLDIYVKLLGSDTLFLSLGDGKHTSIESLIDKFFDYIDSGMKDAKDFSNEIRGHTTLLDLDAGYPTATGLALRLTIESAATTRVEFASSTDFKTMLNNPKDTKIDMKFVPSANVEVSGSLMIDADVVTTGLKVVSTLHTSTGGNVVAKMVNDGRGFDIQFGLPLEKQEIISFNHELLFLTRQQGHMGVEKKLKFDQDQERRTQFAGCFDQLADAIGLTVCGDVSVPWLLTNDPKRKPVMPAMTPKGPLSGPAKFSVHLEKKDLDGFHITGFLDDKKEHQRRVEFVVEALGSKVPRKITFLTEVINRDDLKSAKVSLDAPNKKTSGSFAIANSNKEKSVSAEYKDDDVRYYGKVGVAIANERGKEIFTPLLDFQYPGGSSKDFKIGGSVQRERRNDGVKYTFNGLGLVNTNSNYQLNGWVMLNEKQHSLETDLKLKLNKDSATLTGKIVNLQKGPDDQTLTSNMEFHNTVNPDADFTVELNAKSNPKLRTLSFLLVHGPDKSSKINRITYSSTFKHDGTDEDFFDIDFTNKLSYPLWEFEEENSLVIKPKNYKIAVKGKFETSKADIDLELQHSMKQEDDLYTKFKVILNDKGIDSDFKFDVTGDDKGNFVTKAEFHPGGKYDASGTIYYRFEEMDINAGINMRCKCPDKKDEYKFDTGLVFNAKNLNAHTKFSAGKNDIIDTFVKLAKEPALAGNCKIMIKNLVDGHGQIKMNPQDNKGNGMLLIDLLKTKRKLKFDGTFLINSPNYNANVDLYYDFEKDNSKKITFSTHNKLDKQTLDTKNSIASGSEKMDFTLKGTATDFFEGAQNGVATISHSNGKSLTFKLDRELEMDTDDEEYKYRVESLVAYTHEKGAKPYTLTHKNKFDMRKGKVDFENHITFVKPTGENIDHKALAKMDEKDNRNYWEGKTELSGSMAPNVISFFGTCDYNSDIDDDKADVKYRYKGSYGPKTSIDSHGSFNYMLDTNEDTKVKADSDIAFTFPLEKAQNIKFTTSYYLFTAKDQSLTEGKTFIQTNLNSDQFKYEFDYSMGKEQGKSEIKIQVPQQDDFSAKGTYKITPKDGKIDYVSGVVVEYGKKQKFSIDINGNRVQDQGGAIHSVILLPTDLKTAKKIITDINYKKPSTNVLDSDFTFDIDGEKHFMTLNTDFTNPNTPMVDLKVTCPNKKPFRFYSKTDALDSNTIRGQITIEHLGDFDLDSKINGRFHSPDDFDLKLYMDCEKMKMKKVDLHVTNEASTKGTKKIDFSATEDGKNVLSGSTTYQSRTEGNKFTMEGSGSLKYKGQQKSTSFKYIKDKLSDPNEKGTEVFMNVALGEMSFVSEYKRTNLIYKTSNAYCEEKKQCAHFNVYRKVDDTDPNRFVSEGEVSIDLRKLGFIPEFGLQTKTELERFQLPTHNFDVHMNLDKSKYHSQVYTKRDKGNYVAAFTVSTPHRVMSLESSTTYPDLVSKRPPLPFTHETAFYTNKLANPKAKTLFKATFDCKHAANQPRTTEGELLFSNPSLEKDLHITGKTTYDRSNHHSTVDIVLDIFKKKQQKIVISGKVTPTETKEKIIGSSELHIDGTGLGFDIKTSNKIHIVPKDIQVETRASLEMDKHKKECSVVLSAKPAKQTFVVKIPTRELVNFESNTETKEGEGANVNAKLVLYGDTAFNMQGEVVVKPTFRFSLTTGKTDSTMVAVSGKIEPTKMSELKVESVERNKRKPLAYYSVKIENKALKSDSQMNSENIKGFADAVTADLKKFSEHTNVVNQQISDQTTKDVQRVTSMIQVAAPDFKSVTKSLSDELNKIREELNNDKSLEQFIRSFNEVLTAVINTVSEIARSVTNIVEKSTEMITETTNKFVQVFNERILPELTNIYNDVSKAALSVVQALVDVTTHYIVIASNIIEKISVELKPFFDSINAIVQDASKIFVQRFQEAWGYLTASFGEIKETIVSSPILATIQEKWVELNIGKEISSMLMAANEYAKAISPTEEFTALMDHVVDYLTKKLNNEPCDDVAEIKKTFALYDKAQDSVAALLKINIDTQEPVSLLEMFVPAPLSMGFITTPNKPVPISLSLTRLAADSDIPDIDDWFIAYRPDSLNPMDWIPPYKLRGLIVGGEHVFTFDGRHMTFPGDCKYVVSQDAVDGNFSIILNLAKGSPKSIIFVDKSGYEVEVNTNKQLMLNGQQHGFPLISADTISWKEQSTFTIMSQYGVRVKCDWKFDMCYYEISGYYLGKVRGILGDGNNEPFDDFRMPNGIITDSESDFGNSYALTPGCPKVKTVDHSHHGGHHGHGSNSWCDAFFGEDASMSACYRIVRMMNFKQACQHATTGLTGDEAKSKACLISKAYAMACRSSAIPVDLPDDCQTCVVENKVYDDSWTVNSPFTKADIIVAVETTKANENTYKELVVPLMTSIVNELKGKKVDDVNLYLVGVTPKFRYPIFYDVNNNKLQGSKIEFRDEQRSKKWESPVTTNIKEVDYFLNNFTIGLQELRVELGIENIHLTHAMLGLMRLRPDAYRTMIMVNSEPCAEAILPFQDVTMAAMNLILEEFGIVTHLIAPFDEIKVKSSKPTTVVGFSEKFVFLLADKKRGLANSNMRPSLSHSDDACVSHAEETNGNVYSSKTFASLNPGQKKTFTTMVSNTIVDSMINVDWEKECDCAHTFFNLDGFVYCQTETRRDNRKPASRKK